MPKKKSEISSIPVSKQTRRGIKKLKVGGESFDKLLRRRLLKKTDKKGIATANIFLFIILAFIAVIVLGIFLYTYNAITTSFSDSGVEMAGQVNLTNATQSTIGKINTAMLNQANVISIIFLFAMVFAMFIVAYLTRDKSPAIFFVLDILIIIFAYILAVYISNAYETVLNSLPFQSIFISNLNLASTFLFQLPKITLIVGVIVMIISYSAIPKTKEEEVAGY